MKFFLLVISFIFSVNVSPAQTVYRTPSGACYHTATCRTVKNVSTALSLRTAASQGLRACKICKPSSIQPTGIIKQAKGTQTSTSQCRGTTKAGNRCKHMTSIGNGYCFQHQQ